MATLKQYFEEQLYSTGGGFLVDLTAEECVERMKEIAVDFLEWATDNEDTKKEASELFEQFKIEKNL